MKKILGLMAIMALASSQISFSAKSDTDAAVQRLVKVAKQRQAQQAKDAAKGVVDESDRIKPKSPIEKLEYNAAKAMDRVDFYERVVRSVQREEKELGEFDSVLGRDGVKNAPKKTRRVK